MKVLILAMGEQRAILDNLFKEVCLNLAACDVFLLSKSEQLSLGKTLSRLSYQDYDRVVIFSRLKRLKKQLPVLRCIPGLIFLEHDACQNYMSFSKYYGKYSEFYKNLPWVRILSSGNSVANRLRQEGGDAVFVSKGYDEKLLKNMRVPRDIELAFIGSLKNKAYEKRSEILRQISDESNLLITRTNSGEEYSNMLNRVRIFVSADIGMGEYMIKNFEAMACGGVLLAWSQGADEDSALGFVDEENVMLYRSVPEALEKINMLKVDNLLAERIASAGQALAEKRFKFSNVGHDLARAIEKPMRPWPGVSFWQKTLANLFYGLKV